MSDKIQVYHQDGHRINTVWKSNLASESKQYVFKVIKNAWKKNNKTFIDLPLGIENGDILIFKNHVTKFFVKKWVAYTDKGGSTYEISRLDKCRTSQFDLDKLTEGQTGIIRGYVNKPNKY